jgi:SOS-response transcriptional repressor LexA
MILTASVVALAAAAVTACGGSDDAGALSKSAFAKQANELCANAKSERDAQLGQLPPNPSGPTDAQKLRSVASTDRELIRRVDALVPPEAEQDQVDKVLDGWRRRATLEEKYAMRLPQSLETFTAEVAQIDATVTPIANQLGMTQCTSAPR